MRDVTCGAVVMAVVWGAMACGATPPEAPVRDPYLIADLNVLPDADQPGHTRSSFPSFLSCVNERAYFVAFTGDNIGPGALFVTDGTSEGTQQVRDFDDYPHNLMAVEGRLVFTAGHQGVWGVWTTDGTEAGTVLLAEIPPVTTGQYNRAGNAQLPGKALFSVLSPSSGASGGIWATDGTTSGTTRISDSGNTFLFGVLGSSALFTIGSDPAVLWKTDGTSAGTQTVGGLAFPVERFTRTGSDVLYAETRRGLGYGVMRTDGTAAGTTDLFTIPSGRFFNNYLFEASSGALLYSTTASDDSAPELWRTDGSSVGTKLGDLRALAAVEMDGATYVFGEGAWRLEGATVTPLTTAAALLQPTVVAEVNGSFLWGAEDETGGYEPWITDGTAQGTRRLVDLEAGAAGSRPSGFTRCGQTVLFAASAGTTGEELWVLTVDERN